MFNSQPLPETCHLERICITVAKDENEGEIKLCAYEQSQKEGQSGEEDERGCERRRRKKGWSSGKRSEPGPWGMATDEVAE